MTQLTLTFLGAPRIARDRANLHIQRRKAVALLAYLAVTQTPHRRDALATLLWPDFDQTGARDNLRRTLSALHQTLDHKWLEIGRSTVRLPVQPDLWVDVVHFDQLLTRVQSHHQPSDQLCDECLSLLNQAAQLYTGGFLAGFTLADSPGFDEWQAFETQRLRIAYAGSLARLGNVYRERGESAPAIDYTRRWVALDPLHEPAHRLLIRLYAQTGQQFAALRQYERCAEILQSELGAPPAPETALLYDQVRERKVELVAAAVPPPAVARMPRHNLPTQTIPFVGREPELADLNRLLADPASRLVTILAPGGMGKTRLALEAARKYLEVGQDRVCFVDLAPLTTSGDIVSAIANAVGYPFQQDERSAEQQLLDYFREKRILLVLDNFEHLLARVAFVDEILRLAPQVKILVTSRERLQLSAETVFALAGLEFPACETLSNAAQTRKEIDYNAVKLFVQSAQRVCPRFTLAATDLTHVVRICRLVQGMPLGILLAAAWVDLISPREIAEEISRSLDFLETELRDVPDRQRSIRAVFEHAWGQLSDAERTVFMKLSVFRGGFTRAAAQVVAGASLRMLSVLANKSLLQRQGNGRYTLHELLRQYAEAELAATDLMEPTRDRHSAYFADFLKQREADLKGHRQKTAADEIEADFDNVRSTWKWVTERFLLERMSQAINSLGLIYEWFGRYQEGEAAFARAADELVGIETGQGRRSLVNALIWQARLGEVLGRNEQARQLLRQSLALLETPALAAQDTHSERAAILLGLGKVAHSVGEFQEAERFYDQSLTLYRSLCDRWGEARTLLALESIGGERLEGGDPSQQQRQVEASKQLVLESLAIYRELGDQSNIASGLLALGVTYLKLGQASEAQAALEECIIICTNLGRVNNTTLISATGFLGVALEHLGLYKQMWTQGQLALTLARGIGDLRRFHLGLYLTGCAAVAEEAYLEAQQLLQEDVALSRSQGFKYLPFSLACLSYATYRLGNNHEAQQQLVEALQIALEARLVRATPIGLLSAALLFADQGDVERAVELKALVWRFPFIANSRWCEDVAGKHITAAAASLPPAAIAAAQVRGRTRDLWVTVAEVLTTLQHDNETMPPLATTMPAVASI